jgi:hypothetical protein
VPEGVAFEVDHFAWIDDRLEVSGRWYGLRGHRFVRPALTVEVDDDGDDRRRMLADLEHKPWAADDGTDWTAAFPWDGDPVELARAELAVAPTLAVDLPLPRVPGGRKRAPRERRKAPTARPRERERDEAVRERDSLAHERDEAVRERDSLTRERDEAIAERDALARERDEAVRERDALAHEREPLPEAVAERDALAREVDSLTAARDAAISARDAAAADRAEAVAERDALAREVDSLIADRDAAISTRDGLARERDAAVRARAAAVAERDEARRSLAAAISERDRAAVLHEPDDRPLPAAAPRPLPQRSAPALWGQRLVAVVALGVLAFVVYTLLEGVV